MSKRNKQMECYLGTDGVAHRVWRTGENDTSPLHNIRTRYNPECSHCWLNAEHSELAHSAKLAHSAGMAK